MKIAIVHDWLFRMRGGEHVLEMLCAMFPQADIFTLFSRKEKLAPLIANRNIVPSCFSQLPAIEKYYRFLFPLYPLAVWDLNRKIEKHQVFRKYDLVISVSHCVAKNIVVPDSCKHICYCLTPMRYVWDQYQVYFGNSKFEPLIRPIAKLLRSWDQRRAVGVDRFVAISDFVAQRIRRVYGQKADVIFPPVPTDWLKVRAEGMPGNGFLCVHALVPYKNTKLIVEAFNELGLPLTIVGSGPELEELRALAKANIKFIPYIEDGKLAELYRDSRALVFAAEEDFGMSPVEMQASGRPVIALKRGGAEETVTVEAGRATGVFFSEPTKESLLTAVNNFLDREAEFTVNNCVEQAKMFSVSSFERKFCNLLNSCGLSAEISADHAVETSRRATLRRMVVQR